MDKYTKAVLAVVALCVLALPVKAEEKVWYCEMTGFSRTSLDGIEKFKEERFRMLVTPNQITLASNGYFDNLAMPIVEFNASTRFVARDRWSSLYFQNKNLMYSVFGLRGFVESIVAQCDVF